MPDGNAVELTLDPAEVKIQANQCLTGSTTLYEIMNKVKTLSTNIAVSWKGAASTKYCEILDSEGCDSIRSMADMCSLMSQELDSVASNLETADTSTASAYEGN